MKHPAINWLAVCAQRRAGRLTAVVTVLSLLAFLRTQYLLVLVAGESMEPTLHHGDLAVVSRSACRTTPLRRGDVILVQYGPELMVKRLVALPGDEVEIQRGALRLNGALVPEPYRQAAEVSDDLNIEKGKLGADRFAVLGDNRAVPSSVFVYAVVSGDQIIGRLAFPIHLRR